jgi:cell division protein FtsA
VTQFAGERVVLTGGTSALVGMGEFAANVLGCPVRVAAPHEAVGMPQSVASPAFSTVAGLLAIAAAGGGEEIAGSEREPEGKGYLGRVGRWLKAGFG